MYVRFEVNHRAIQRKSKERAKDPSRFEGISVAILDTFSSDGKPEWARRESGVELWHMGGGIGEEEIPS
jgi:hypothetical protein